MIEIKIKFKYFNFELLIGNTVNNDSPSPNPWWKNNKGEIPNEEDEDIIANQEEVDEEIHWKTHISEMANKYQTELNTQAIPSKSNLDSININRSDVSSLSSEPIFLHQNKDIYGIYNIDKDNDELRTVYNDYPDVEIIDDEYEKQLSRATKRANQRYATYKDTHDID